MRRWFLSEQPSYERSRRHRRNAIRIERTSRATTLLRRRVESRSFPAGDCIRSFDRLGAPRRTVLRFGAPPSLRSHISTTDHCRFDRYDHVRGITVDYRPDSKALDCPDRAQCATALVRRDRPVPLVRPRCTTERPFGGRSEGMKVFFRRMRVRVAIEANVEFRFRVVKRVVFEFAPLRMFKYQVEIRTYQARSQP